MIYENVFAPVTSLLKSPVRTGGLCKIIFFKWGDVPGWPSVDPETAIITGDIELIAGASFFLIEAIDKNRTFIESKKRSAAGSYYDIEVNGELAGNILGNILGLNTMDFHDFGVIVFDRDGQRRLVGNSDSGATLIHDYTSGDINNSRKRKLKFAWQHPSSAPVYSSDTLDVILGGGGSVFPGVISFIMRFRVGIGQPMNSASTTLTNPLFANRKLLVIGSGSVIPCDDGSGDIDWTGAIERHYEKTFSQDTITWVGGVGDNEIIEIYAVS